MINYIIHLQLIPGFVCTKLIKSKTPAWFLPDATDFVRSALKTVGIADFTTGYYLHTLYHLLIRIGDYLVPSLTRLITIKFMGNFEDAVRKYCS